MRRHRSSQPSVHDHEAFSLPGNLSWLKDTVVELLVDQEGFRGSLLRFKLAGFPKQARGWDSADGGGLALFRPVKRETFRFHWAPFDADLPVIRRLTVNGDESRDFLSRQASLSLKTNGVYTVQGSESSHLPASCVESGDLGSAKLRWRYEYLVEDRFHESGRKVDGEKNLTPISFLCSPYLLHPSQARKLTLMSLHFFKKSAATKLVAEKLEPPTSSSRFGQTLPVKAVTTNIWTLHRRSKSRKKAKSLRRTKERRDENQELVPAGRRRRASSAGEERRPTQSGVRPATLHDNRLTKHIVPRAQLAELLNAEPGEDGVPGFVRQLPSDFQGLRPAPRR
ncbi:hypothetical protein B0H16DRAFT_1490561 [Mycena metata]|uniref:Uncharacterized protein n=1 Tax=Mycena metata TaxID=1033252 RepID=A0AAD7P3A9_9AGAR|nr:hypothetical protein B0H16DRAFT_1490561 [Mycena metata]